MKNIKVKVANVKPPVKDNSKQPIMLNEATMVERKNKIINNMKEANISTIFIYADKEHGGSFEYLTGFIPRFEEALLALTVGGECTLLLGNENFNKAKFSLTNCSAIKCPLFSLPNQPVDSGLVMEDYLKQVKIDDSGYVGLVDWKLLSNDYEDFKTGSSVPHFVVESLKSLLPSEKLVNGTQLLIHPEKGARVTNNANEIAHYEYGASLASDAILDGMNQLREGISELEAGEIIQKDGQLPNVVTIAAFGPRFKHANIYPTDNTLKLGDTVALTVSHKGGLSSRSGYAVNTEEELEQFGGAYLEEMAIPYYKAYINWLNTIKIGKNGHEFYTEFEAFYPQSIYGWELNPGHLTADEEWLSSPFFKGSKASVQSGMIFAVDFIPNRSGFSGVSAESTVAIADKELREEIEKSYPELWSRIVNRRNYMARDLGIELSEELLPLASTLGYYRPFLLNSREAFVIE